MAHYLFLLEDLELMVVVLGCGAPEWGQGHDLDVLVHPLNLGENFSMKIRM